MKEKDDNKEERTEKVDKPGKSDSAEIWGNEEYQFHGQRADERVMLVRNQHIIVLAPTLILAAITLIIPFFVIKWLSGAWELWLLVVYGLILASFVGSKVYAYQNGVSVLSDQRIINVIQKGFFSRRIGEAELDRIQDVSSDIKGMFPTMFGYGDVTIRTASKDNLLVLKNVANPFEVQQAIVRAQKGTK